MMKGFRICAAAPAANEQVMARAKTTVRNLIMIDLNAAARFIEGQRARFASNDVSLER